MQADCILCIRCERSLTSPALEAGPGRARLFDQWDVPILRRPAAGMQVCHFCHALLVRTGGGSQPPDPSPEPRLTYRMQGEGGMPWHPPRAARQCKGLEEALGRVSAF